MKTNITEMRNKILTFTFDTIKQLFIVNMFGKGVGNSMIAMGTNCLIKVQCTGMETV